MMNAEERVIAIAKMKQASHHFYFEAIRIENHPFIEFCGLMNEYIKACEAAHAQGIDFSECNAHSGIHLPMEPFMVNYVNEKLQCIFTGRSVMVGNIAVKKEAIPNCPKFNGERELNGSGGFTCFFCGLETEAKP